VRPHSLFLAANLLAAFGGGTILARGIGVLKGTAFQEGSLLAFLVGTVVGLAFYRLIPSRLSTPVSQWFSVAGAVASAGLLTLYVGFANPTTGRLAPGLIATAFFSLLVIRFAFWFYSRVMRANRASEEEQGIAWVELGYYGGAAAGLVVWGLLATSVDITVALGVDIALQVLAGGMDLLAYRSLSIQEVAQSSPQPSVETERPVPAQAQQPDQKVSVPDGSIRRCWTLVTVVALLTIGTQVVLFDMAHHTREDFAPYILACFYLGVAIAAFICKRLAVTLWWEPPTDGSVVAADRRSTIFVITATAGLLLVLVVVVGRFAITALDAPSPVIQGDGDADMSAAPVTSSWWMELLLLAGVVLAALIYEMVALAAFERISEESRRYNLKGWVIMGYAAMAVGAALSLLLLRLSYSPMLTLLAVAIGCWGYTLVALRRGRVSWVK
jgi:hypothetical protein